MVHNYGHGGCGISLAPGCASEVVRLLPDAASVGVLGAGVVGLSAARRLLLAGKRVRVHAERVAEETTSAVAGALWLPTGLDFPGDGPRREWLNGMLRESFSFYQEQMGTARYAGTIEPMAVYEPEGSPDGDHLFEAGVITRETATGAMPGSMSSGYVYRSQFVHNPDYIGALRDEIRELGGEIRQVALGSLDDVLSLEEPALVNCLGLGARDLFGDEAVFPARGVLVLMRPQALGYAIHDGYKYCFPRKSALILGGTFEPGVDSTETPDETVREILEHHRAFFAAHAPA